jgi:murein DD-endopeptidase MepM/ murein hydrolase activator NlpD
MINLEAFLAQCQDVKILDSTIDYSSYFPINLSESNVDLIEIDIKNPLHLAKYLNDKMSENNSIVAYGGYCEKRLLYKSSSLFNNSEKQRDIHIGIDLWVSQGTAVLAALDGTAYGYANNKGAGNYGPTIILKHEIENHIFYTLYGHLSLESMEKIEIGRKYFKGQKIAVLGNLHENGGYTPHLHFQIIKNIQGNFNDYPGVCNINDLSFYTDNCPDPNLLLQIEIS